MINNTWRLKAIGNSSGTIKIKENAYPLDTAINEQTVKVKGLPTMVEMTSVRGKFSDSEDSFLYLYYQIDPIKQNIDLSAKIDVLSMDEAADYQTGFGIMAADTAFSEGKPDGRWCRHRNHLLLGCFRTADGNSHGCGMRIVGGYTSSDASEYEPVRKLDPRRSFAAMEQQDSIREGASYIFSFKKTDQGFQGSLVNENISETIFFPGCDFLMKQDKEYMCIGFAAAGKVRIRISDITMKITDGAGSHTPENEIQSMTPDYPFAREVFEKAETCHTFRKIENAIIYVSPEGEKDNEGSPTSPLDLQTAIELAGPGCELVLEDGIYKPKQAYYIPSWAGGTLKDRTVIRAEHSGQAILDGSELQFKTPLMVLRGRFWIIEGIIFQKSPLSGLFLCGSGNHIRNCQACYNGDTGILICAYPGTSGEDWPEFNQVDFCDSYDNCDPVMCNADGFGAKLFVGRGNGFYQCIAHHNIDDGFDLYTKSILGPIEPVTIEQCIAYGNGKTQDGHAFRKNHSGGTGFKLGGENQAVEHEVWDCIAFSNQQYGFSSNSNPAVHLHYCTSLRNGQHTKRDNFHIYSRSGMAASAVFEGLFPPVSADGICKRTFSSLWISQVFMNKDWRPKRKKDGTIYFAGKKRIFFKHKGAVIGRDRKNILMLIASLGGGGAERVTSILASDFSKKNTVHLLYLYKKEKTYPVSSEVHLIDGSYSKGSSLNKLFHIPVRWPFFMFSIMKAKCRYHIDTTISMLHRPNLYNGLLWCGDRRIMSERNDPSRKPAREFENARKSFQRGDHIVFQSRRVQGLFNKQIQEKSSIIRNPISVSCYADAAPDHRIVTVGRYTAQKNHALLIEAFALFYKNHPTYTLHFYGDGELQDNLQALIEERQLQDAIFLEGFKPDVHQHIKNAKMFVLSSDYEGMSNALMEAMMMGLPCISTACTGSDELIEPETTGLLVPVGDAKALALAMSRLADDKLLCNRLRDKAQLYSLEFEKKAVIRAWERIMFR